MSGNGFTHLSYSFAWLKNVSGKIATYGDDYVNEVILYDQFNGLKMRYPNLKTIISVGGWSFNNPAEGTSSRFSTVAATSVSRKKFAEAVIEFLQTYKFDGIDLDWEFPGDFDRGGSTADFTNYGLLVTTICNEFNNVFEKYTITMAVPVSRYNVEIGFNLTVLSQQLDSLNIMAYDIHGSWDDPKIIGSHTDLRFIHDILQYLFDCNVPNDQIVLGLAAYGRSYILANLSCHSPGCAFTSAGPG